MSSHGTSRAAMCTSRLHFGAVKALPYPCVGPALTRCMSSGVWSVAHCIELVVEELAL